MLSRKSTLKVNKTINKYCRFSALGAILPRGFTLVETLVTIGIFLVIISGVMGAIVGFYRNSSYIWDYSIAIDEARRGVDLMIKEIREAREGEDGSYLIEKAGDKEIVFYSDIDNDNRVERVRYFLSTINSGAQSRDCYTNIRGGSCSVNFSSFLQGTLKSAQVRVFVEGDLGQSGEYVDISDESRALGSLCPSGCTDCAGAWQGTTVYDVMSEASDNFLQFVADGSSKVDPSCSWQNPNHSLKARFDLFWTEEIAGVGNELKKGVIEPTGFPVSYPVAQEKITVITPYLRNAPPIFEYYDASGVKIDNIPARLVDTKVAKIFLVVDVNPNQPPDASEIESYVYPRNLNAE